jgi:ketosteroid isomerase-like protein
MATESMKRLEAGIEAWNRRDIDAALEHFSEDTVWRTGGQPPDVEDVYEGHEGVRRFFERFMDPWDQISISIEDVFEDTEEQIFCRVRFQARGRGGIEVDGSFFHIYRANAEHRVTAFIAFGAEDEDDARREAAAGRRSAR